MTFFAVTQLLLNRVFYFILLNHTLILYNVYTVPYKYTDLLILDIIKNKKINKNTHLILQVYANITCISVFFISHWIYAPKNFKNG